MLMESMVLVESILILYILMESMVLVENLQYGVKSVICPKEVIGQMK